MTAAATSKQGLHQEVIEKTRILSRSLEATRWNPDGGSDQGTRSFQKNIRPDCDVIARSPAMREILNTVIALRDSDLPILIMGESGTGKETIARAIHLSSRRRSGPFIVQNMGSIPSALFEADFFGHESGAYTGAEKTRSGFLLQAQGGTFVLDEISEADAAVQQKLFRIIEDKKIRPVGGRLPAILDVRFIATTHEDLEKRIQRGEFRKELYFRLGAVRLHLPPLRERPDDVLLLFRRFFEKLCGYQPKVSPAVKDRLLSHPWPGNIRELESFTQRLAMRHRTGDKTLSLAAVDESLGSPPASGPISPGLFRQYSYEELQKSLEMARLRHLIEAHQGNLDAMARELGESLRSLYRRFERYGLKPKELIKQFKLEKSR